MARFAGVDIPNEKRIVISLTYVYGVGLQTAKKVLAAAGVSEDVRTKDLTSDQEDAIRRELDGLKLEGDLRREVNLNIKRLMFRFTSRRRSPSTLIASTSRRIASS